MSAREGPPTAAGRSVAQPSIPWGTQFAVYATGTFGNTSNNVVTVILPLWALHLGAEPLMIGIVLGARHFLATIFSIHGGALMDRLGTRRVLLWFGLIGAVTPFLFPLMPWIWAVVVLQVLAGLSSTFGWMGAQAMIGQSMGGSAVHAGRLTFAVRIGLLLAPLAAGVGWDLGGPWGGFSVMGVWGIGIFAATLTLPKPADGGGAGAPVRGRDLAPRLGDYVYAFRMAAVPAILLVVMASALRMSGQGMQFSFYVVYLEGIGLTGTLIGVLLAAGSLVGFAVALSVGAFTRLFASHWLLLAAVAGGILSVAVTPLLGALFLLLLVAAGLRGGCMALAQPLMISILSRAAGRDQGKGVGLRTTANRFVALTVPVAMGAVVEVVGLEASFLVVGGILIALCGAVARYAHKRPEVLG